MLIRQNIFTDKGRIYLEVPEDWIRWVGLYFQVTSESDHLLIKRVSNKDEAKQKRKKVNGKTCVELNNDSLKVIGAKDGEQCQVFLKKHSEEPIVSRTCVNPNSLTRTTRITVKTRIVSYPIMIIFSGNVLVPEERTLPAW